MITFLYCLASFLIGGLIFTILGALADEKDAQSYLKKHGNLDGFWFIKNK